MKPLYLMPSRQRGFTLIEMLVVIGIIAILATIAVPSGMMVMRKARETQAKAEMGKIVTAVTSYRTEYNRLPSSDATPPTTDNDGGYDTNGGAEGQAILELMFGDAGNDRNSRQIAFYEPPPMKKGGGGYSESTGLVDIWGTNGYRIVLDYDGDGKVEDPYGVNTNGIRTSVIVFCAGANKQWETGNAGKTDDLKTWD